MHNLSPIIRNYRPMKYCRLSTVLIMGFFIVIVSTTSCSKKALSSSNEKTAAMKTSLNLARLVDIPIPLGFVPSYEESSAQTSMLQLQGTKPLKNSLQFYLQEMDRFGWKLTNFSTHTRGVLLCEKGHQTCIVDITEQEKTTVTLHIRTQRNKKQRKCLNVNKKQLEKASNL